MKKFEHSFQLKGSERSARNDNRGTWCSTNSTRGVLLSVKQILEKPNLEESTNLALKQEWKESPGNSILKCRICCKMSFLHHKKSGLSFLDFERGKVWQILWTPQTNFLYSAEIRKMMECLVFIHSKRKESPLSKLSKSLLFEVLLRVPLFTYHSGKSHFAGFNALQPTRTPFCN